MTKSPQQLGRDYEAELVDRYGGIPQPASGAGPRRKLDLRIGRLLVSAKRTQNASYRLTAADLQEALAGAQGPGGRGEIPAMAIKIQGFPDDVFVLRGSDLRSLLEGEVKIDLPPTKRNAKLQAASEGARSALDGSSRFPRSG